MLKFDFRHTQHLLPSDQKNLCDHLRQIDIAATVDRRVHLSAALWIRWLQNLLNNGKQIIPVATYQKAGEDCQYMDCYIFCIGSVEELRERGIDVDG